MSKEDIHGSIYETNELISLRDIDFHSFHICNGFISLTHTLNRVFVNDVTNSYVSWRRNVKHNLQLVSIYELSVTRWNKYVVI